MSESDLATLAERPRSWPEALERFGPEIRRSFRSDGPVGPAWTLVEGIVALAPRRLADLFPDEGEAGRARQRAIAFMDELYETPPLEALVGSLAYEFPATPEFDHGFRSVQGLLVKLLRAEEAPLFPVPTPDGRRGAAAFWRERIELPSGRMDRHRAREQWRRRRGLLVYEALAPLPRDESVLHDRVTRFVLDVLARDAREVSADWGTDIVSAQSVIRYVSAPHYAIEHPHADFVPHLISILNGEDPHWRGWLPSDEIVLDLQRALVALTAEREAPRVVNHWKRKEVTAFWTEWLGERPDGFRLPTEEAGRAALEDWETAGAGKLQRHRLLKRVADPVLTALAYPVGMLVMLVYSYMPNEPVSHRKKPLKTLGRIVWFPFAVALFLAFFLVQTVVHVVWWGTFAALVLVFGRFIWRDAWRELKAKEKARKLRGKRD